MAVQRGERPDENNSREKKAGGWEGGRGHLKDLVFNFKQSCTFAAVRLWAGPPVSTNENTEE